MNALFEPYASILSREIEHEITKKELASYAETLDKLVAIGTHLLKWELTGDVDDSVLPTEVIILGVAFKRLLELLDSIALQIKVGAVSTAVIQLRVLFELGVQFEHLLTDDTLRRCQCMLLTDYCRRLEELNKIPIADQSLEEKSSINDLNALINRPEFSNVKAEYAKLRLNKKQGEIKWYNLFNHSVSDFSKLVNQKFTKYKVHYKAINKDFGNDAVHSTNLLRGNLIQEDGVLSIVQMRNSLEAIGLAGIAFS